MRHHRPATYFYFMCVGVLPACEDVRSPGTGVTDICELPCGFWELNSGPLEEPVLLIPEAVGDNVWAQFTGCLERVIEGNSRLGRGSGLGAHRRLLVAGWH